MRRVVTWLMLILFGTVSLLGQGLHVLVGCHPITHQALADHSAEAHPAGCGCSRSSSSPAQPAEDNRRDGRMVAGHGDDCVICRFLAQGRDVPRVVLPPCVQFTRPHQAVVAYLFSPLLGVEPYHARAPPAIS